MNKKIFVSILATLILTSIQPAHAQKPAKVPRIGMLFTGTASPPSARIEAFRKGLRDLGYIEGQNIILEWRFAEGKLDRLPDLATNLVRLPVDIIVTATNPAITAAKNATKTIPIIMALSGDPVAAGHVASLARPGGNITGFSTLAPEISGKRLELLKEILRKVPRVGVLWNPRNSGMVLRMEEAKVAAKALNVKLLSVEVNATTDFDGAFSTLTSERPEALLTFADPLTRRHQQRIVDFTLNSRLPAIYEFKEWVDVGGLVSYGPDDQDNFRRAAIYVDKILKGTKPGDLPVQQPMRFELVINLQTAKQIGVTIPPEVLMRADRVIK